MTVAELIEKLKLLPPTLRVFVPGYEGGLEDVVVGEETAVNLDVYDSDFYGRHDVDEGWQDRSGVVQGVVLFRARR